MPPLRLILCIALVGLGLFQPGFARSSVCAAEPRHAAADYTYQFAPPIHAAETCLAITWANLSGAPRSASQVYEWMGHEIGDEPTWTDVVQVAKRIGITATTRNGQLRTARHDRAERLLADDLARSPVLLRLDVTPTGVRAGVRAIPSPHWVLALPTPVEAHEINCLDPQQGAPGLLRFSRAQFLARWQAAERTERATRDETLTWLPLNGKQLAPPAKLTPHSRYEYARKMASIRRRIQEVLVDDSPDSPTVEAFTVVVERPFVVVGDMPPSQMKRWAEGTIRWAVEKMKRQYFHRDPTAVLEVWLFDGKSSYERNVTRLFGSKPSTPYGYYSPRNGALVMNIRTGGGTLVHELLHPFMESNFPACPAWFNEGLASLYEQSADNDGLIWGKTNWRLAGLQRAIANRGIPSFKELCGTTTHEFYDDASGVHYAQARYLCYYLQEHHKLGQFYRDFRKNAEDDPGGYQTLAKLLGEDDMVAFQKRWQDYVMKLRFP